MDCCYINKISTMRRAILLTAILLAVTAIKIDTAYVNDPIDCIKQKCPDQYEKCEKDSKCVPALEDCYKKCGSKQSCWTFCLPGKGSQAAIDTAKCAAANGCNGVPIEPVTAVMSIGTPLQCVEAKCKDQLRTCQRDAKCFPALQDCEKECVNNTACYSTCLAKKGNGNATNLWACIINNDCLNQLTTAVALADPIDCIKQKCPSEYDRCEKDPKCVPALQDCEKKCGTKESCWTICLAGKGSSAATDTAKCAAKNGCNGVPVEEVSTAIAIADPQQCIEEKCPTQWAACQKDSKCVPALQDCEKKCGSSKSCWTLCLPSKGSQAAVDVAKCADSNHCLGSASETRLVLASPDECILKYCKTEEEACVNDRRCVGTLDECDRRCNVDLTCWNNCISKSGSKSAIDYFGCIMKNDCLNKFEESTAVALSDPIDCIKQKCPDQYEKCEKDSKCVPALEDCYKKCGSKQSCWTFCLPGKGSQAAIDTAKCAAANGCNGVPVEEVSTAIAIADPQQCIEEKCPTQWAACQKDSKCVPALQDCEKKCGSSKSCWTLCLPSKGSQAAVDVAKCADSNHCLGFVPGFETCIYKSCQVHHDSCLSNLACRHSLIKCRVASGLYNFDLECLTAQAKQDSFLSEWFTCAGEHFCI